MHSKSTNKTIQDTTFLELPFVKRPRTKYERDAKSLSFEVGNDVSDLKIYNRSYSLNSHEIFNQTKLITSENMEIESGSSHEKLKNQIENCQKALQELSLDMINKEPKQLSSPELKFNSDFLLDEFNVKTRNSNADNSDDLFLNVEDRKSHYFDVESDLRNVTISIENANFCSKMNEAKKENHVEDESSDEDPPFWKSSIEGGYFVPQIKKDDTLR